jgi:hypothetical protein
VAFSAGRCVTTILLVVISSSAWGTGTVRLTNRQEAIVFVVRQELAAAGLGGRRDVCLAISEEPVESISQIFSRLGGRIHPNDWCNKGPRGFKIAVIGQIKEPEPDLFQIEVQTSDLRPIIAQGAHFATPLRDGIYDVTLKDRHAANLIRYTPR